jgi:hypothetical protein
VSQGTVRTRPDTTGSILNHTSGANCTLANVFMPAWPFGSSDAHSGYEFSDADADADADAGPPSPPAVATRASSPSTTRAER